MRPTQYTVANALTTLMAAVSLLAAPSTAVDMEGPIEATGRALRIVESACRLAAPPALFNAEAQQKADAGGSADATDLLRSDIAHYSALFEGFRRQTKVALENPDIDERAAMPNAPHVGTAAPVAGLWLSVGKAKFIPRGEFIPEGDD
ncbi:hypothetical protein SM007_28200 [Streptomyces avermitilis]|nr:hypothetical protein SM007_28200 [Streptomyces avermitilis]